MFSFSLQLHFSQNLYFVSWHVCKIGESQWFMLEVGLTFFFVQLLERKIERHLGLLSLWLPSICVFSSVSLFVLPLDSLPRSWWDHWKVCKWMWTVFESEAPMVLQSHYSPHSHPFRNFKVIFFLNSIAPSPSSHSLPHLYPSLLGYSWFSLDFRCIFCPANSAL